MAAISRLPAALRCCGTSSKLCSFVETEFEVRALSGWRSHRPGASHERLYCAARPPVTCSAVNGERIFAQVDGELAGRLPLAAELIPDALTLLVPPTYLAKEQSLIDVPACA